MKILAIMLNMKKILILFAILFAFNSLVYALEPVPVQLGGIENSLWGFEYKKEAEQKRLARIETTVFGIEDKKNTVQDRINKINQTLGLETSFEAQNVLKELDEAESKDVSYPVIDKLEMQYLKKNYTDGIYTRLERLEKSVYGAKQGGQLNERVEKLVASSSYNVSKAQSAKTPQALPSQQYFDPYDSDAYLQIAGLENSIFGQTFGQDPIALRLNRLERKIFQRDFSTDDEFTRLQRLQAASVAKKTSKYYDANKAQKYTSTGIQIGTILLMILAFIL